MFPLGLAYISSAFKKAGHQVKCLNLNHFDGPAELIVCGFVKEFGYFDFVCTGGISTVYRQVKSAAQAVRAVLPESKLILGGGLISSEPALMFADLAPDYIIIGEGEETIVELLACLEKKADLAGVYGIGYRGKSGELVLTGERPPIADIDTLPWPDFEEFGFAKYLDQMHPSDQYYQDLYDFPRVYPVICSRSCPYACTFCYHPIGKKYRQRSVKSVMAELSVMVRRYQINVINIYDELFSNDREWLLDFCQEIKALLKEIPWECKWGCQMRVDKLDDELLKTMKTAGCYMVSYGFESYSQSVLTSMRKHITPQQIDRAVQLTMNNNLSLQANFIFGDPAETTLTTEETLAYWRAHTEAGIMLTFINPYPGTPVYQHCLAKGIIKDKIDFLTNHIFGVFNMTDSMSEGEFIKLWRDLNKASINQRIYAEKLSVKKNKPGTFILEITCPHCQSLLKYGNYKLKSKTYFSTMIYCRACRRRFFAATSLFRLVFKGLAIVYTLAPALSFKFYERIWPKRYLLRAMFRRALRGIFDR